MPGALGNFALATRLSHRVDPWFCVTGSPRFCPFPR